MNIPEQFSALKSRFEIEYGEALRRSREDSADRQRMKASVRWFKDALRAMNQFVVDAGRLQWGAESNDASALSFGDLIDRGVPDDELVSLLTVSERDSDFCGIRRSSSSRLIRNLLQSFDLMIRSTANVGPRSFRLRRIEQGEMNFDVFKKLRGLCINQGSVKISGGTRSGASINISVFQFDFEDVPMKRGSSAPMTSREEAASRELDRVLQALKGRDLLTVQFLLKTIDRKIQWSKISAAAACHDRKESATREALRRLQKKLGTLNAPFELHLETNPGRAWLKKLASGEGQNEGQK